MYQEIRKKIVKKYGSLYRLAIEIGVNSPDIYAAFSGTKPMYPKYKRLIADALGENVTALFEEDSP